MSRNRNRRVLTDMAPYFLGPLFQNKTPKCAAINGFARYQRRFNNLAKRLDNRPADQRVNAGLLTNLLDYILFCHT